MVQLFSRKQTLEDQIQDLKAQLEAQQSESEALAVAKAKAEQEYQLAQSQAQQLQEQLLELQQAQARERHEAELDERIQRLRPLADQLNKSSEAAERDYKAFKAAVNELPAVLSNSIEIKFSPAELPYVVHRQGNRNFRLTSKKEARK